MNFEALFFTAYSLGLLCIGFLSYRRLNGSATDYFFCNRTLGKFTSSLSLSAAVLSGSGLIGGVALVYQIGVAGVFWNLTAVPAWFLVGATITVALRKKGIITIPSFLSEHYGHYTRKLITILQVIEAIIFIGVQIVVASLVLQALLNITALNALIVTTTLLVSYTLLGGMWAVVWGGVFQYFILMLVVLLACGFAFFKAGGIVQVIHALPSKHLDLAGLGIMTPFAWMMLSVYSWATEQAYMQRAFAAKNVQTARFAFIFCGFNTGIFSLAVCGIGFSAFILLPHLKDPQLAFSNLVEVIFPPAIRGFFLLGVIAMAIATASSFLVSSTTILLHDLLEQTPKLTISRIFICVLALFSFISTIFFKDIIDMVVFSTLIAPAAVFVPFLFALYGKDSNVLSEQECVIKQFAGFISIVLAASAGVISQCFLYGKITGLLGYVHPLLVGPIVALISFMAVLSIRNSYYVTTSR